MTDICKCVCGAEARYMSGGPYSGGHVVCAGCTWEGPSAPTQSEAIAAWNRVMRPRPVVQMFHHSKAWGLASCRPFSSLTVHESAVDDTSAELTAAGFDVAESEEA